MINVLAVRVSIKFNLEEFLSNFVVLNCLQNRSAVYYNILVRKNRKVRCQRCKEELSGSIMTKITTCIYAFIIGMVNAYLYLKKKDILIPIVIHMSANIFVNILNSYNLYVLVIGIFLVILSTIIIRICKD